MDRLAADNVGEDLVVMTVNVGEDPEFVAEEVGFEPTIGFKHR